MLNGECQKCGNLDKEISHNFILKDNQCVEKCGKGFRISDELECDDGNQNDGDGCDKNCKVEKDY